MERTVRIGVPNDHGPSNTHEARVALTPQEVHELRADGEHELLVERGAGEHAGYSDQQYIDAGAQLVHRRVEALAPAHLVAGIRWLSPADLEVLSPGAICFSLVRPALAPAELRAAYRAAGVFAISGDRLSLADGDLPIRRRMSELAGALAPQLAARLLESTRPGRYGVLLARVPGVAPPIVSIVGAGTLGAVAARSFAGLGAIVHLLDTRHARLRALASELPANVITRESSPAAIDQVARFSNVLVLALEGSDGHVPMVINWGHITAMRPGAVLLDFSIQTGGASQSSRPIASPDEAYEKLGVLHMTMPNTPALVARTASKRISSALAPFIQQLSRHERPPARWLGLDAFARATGRGDAP